LNQVLLVKRDGSTWRFRRKSACPRGEQPLRNDLLVKGYSNFRHPDLTGLFRGVDEIRMNRKMVAAVANGW